MFHNTVLNTSRLCYLAQIHQTSHLTKSMAENRFQSNVACLLHKPVLLFIAKFGRMETIQCSTQAFAVKLLKETSNAGTGLVSPPASILSANPALTANAFQQKHQLWTKPSHLWGSMQHMDLPVRNTSLTVWRSPLLLSQWSNGAHNPHNPTTQHCYRDQNPNLTWDAHLVLLCFTDNVLFENWKFGATWNPASHWLHFSNSICSFTVSVSLG